MQPPIPFPAPLPRTLDDWIESAIASGDRRADLDQVLDLAFGAPICSITVSELGTIKGTSSVASVVGT